MKCANCCEEMESGYCLQLCIGGVIEVKKKTIWTSKRAVNAIVCPKCGKTELFMALLPDETEKQIPIYRAGHFKLLAASVLRQPFFLLPDG